MPGPQVQLFMSQMVPVAHVPPHIVGQMHDLLLGSQTLPPLHAPPQGSPFGSGDASFQYR